MTRQYDEDFFKDSTMSFGDHLEELRRALFKAVIGLVLATLVGLYFGDKVVGLIQYPLKTALVAYYQQSSFLEADHYVKQPGHTLQIEPAQLLEKLKSENLISKIEYESNTSVTTEIVSDPIELAKQRFQRLSAEQQLDNPKLYSPESFPDLPEALQEQAKKYAELEAAERRAFNAELLKLAFDQNAGNRAKIKYYRVDDYDPLKVKSLNISEGFMIYLKAALLFGAVLSSPWVFYQLWLFVAAGLYPHEKKYVNSFLPLSLFFFLGGASLAFFVVFSYVLSYLLDFNRWLGIDPDPRINEWLGFALVLPLGFGISFQLPLVMLFLERIGIFSVKVYLEKWRIVVLVICIASAILTPADPYSMLFMAGPLCLLYFVGLGLCYYWPRSESKALATPVVPSAD